MLVPLEYFHVNILFLIQLYTESHLTEHSRVLVPNTSLPILADVYWLGPTILSLYRSFLPLANPVLLQLGYAVT